MARDTRSDRGLRFAASLTTGSLGKIGAGVTLMAQTELATIILSGGGRSSAMAHKSNPVNAELLVALARYNAGLRIGVAAGSNRPPL